MAKRNCRRKSRKETVEPASEEIQVEEGSAE